MIKIKPILLILLFGLISINLAAQGSNPPPPGEPPAVPLDGGLIALIAAGGAVGYKKYKQRNTEV